MSILDEFEAELAAARGGQPFPYNPGLTDEEIDQRLAPHGLIAPEGLRRWYRRHDGVSPPPDLPVAPWELGGWRPLSLADALAERQFRAELVAEITAGEPAGTADEVWHPEWLPVFTAGNGDPLVVECNTPTEPDRLDAGMVHCTDGINLYGTLASLDEVLAVWLRALRTGFWRWDGTNRRWRRVGSHLDIQHPLAGWLV